MVNLIESLKIQEQTRKEQYFISFLGMVKIKTHVVEIQFHPFCFHQNSVFKIGQIKCLENRRSTTN